MHGSSGANQFLLFGNIRRGQGEAPPRDFLDQGSLPSLFLGKNDPQSRFTGIPEVLEDLQSLVSEEIPIWNQRPARSHREQRKADQAMERSRKPGFGRNDYRFPRRPLRNLHVTLMPE